MSKPQGIVSVFGSALLFVIGLQSCAPGARYEQAERAGEKLHSQIDGKDYKAIYVASTDDFKSKNREEDFVELVTMMAKAVGTCSVTRLQNRNLVVTPGGDLVELIFQRTCSSKNLEETFQCKIMDGRCRLNALNFSMQSPQSKQ